MYGFSHFALYAYPYCEVKMSGRGGAREGAGRPRLEEKRKKWQMYAYPDEWEIIKRFAKLLKHGEKDACLAALEKVETRAKQ